MKVILNNKTHCILRFYKDEEIFEKLANFCTQESITAASFTIIGKSKEVILSFYDGNIKDYQDKTFSEELELISVIGNVGIMDGSSIIHAHGTFAKPSYEVLGGHIKKIVTSATGEVFLQKLEGTITRELDEETGLFLMK